MHTVKLLDIFRDDAQEVIALVYSKKCKTRKSPCLAEKRWARKHGNLRVWRGGTKLTVAGSNFADESNPLMNITQMPIVVNNSDGTKTFDQVNYPLTPCTVRTDSKMACTTPKLELPPKDDFGSFTAEYRFGFIFEGFEEMEEMEESTNDTRTSISVEVNIVELPPIAEHHWSPYDVTWGVFQEEVRVHVGGLESSIVNRFSDSVQFFPPDKELLNQETGCGGSSKSFAVEVQGGNTIRRAGCLQYASATGDGSHLGITFPFVVPCALAFLLIRC
ncbi:hypothetical protein CAPTEDRAFT_185172 [Capitella teleta]|uniref:IPT/TIG domain-containing protein n=1 Tax=Capitella teleta TaxID=283909 RepID=R7UBJ9_CAPTE|nr:hypothetical protein CAPTEDRAFT_185172 [Capitella teleta]|eukprot:ELU03750.1 hypothetical protein CAPTEDRAFT_185172 [Capitella teleta]